MWEVLLIIFVQLILGFGMLNRNFWLYGYVSLCRICVWMIFLTLLVTMLSFSAFVKVMIVVMIVVFCGEWFSFFMKEWLILILLIG